MEATEKELRQQCHNIATSLEITPWTHKGMPVEDIIQPYGIGPDALKIALRRIGNRANGTVVVYCLNAPSRPAFLRYHANMGAALYMAVSSIPDGLGTSLVDHDQPMASHKPTRGE